MTSDDDFRAQLAADPTDRHTRLVYADWLDDRDRAREAAVQRVLAEPADDAHRLAFAAVCEREGDADRAGFVRGQLAGAPLRLSSGQVWEWFVPWWGRRTYTNVYLVRGGLAVRNGHRPYESREGFIVRRGFVAEVTCAAADWLANGDAICEAHPVERVRLTTAPQREMHPTYGSSGYARLVGREKIEDVGCIVGSRDDSELIRRLLKAEWPGIAFDLPSADGGAVDALHTAQQLGLTLSDQWVSSALGFAPGTVTYTGHEPPVQHADGSFEVAHNFTVAPGG